MSTDAWRTAPEPWASLGRAPRAGALGSGTTIRSNACSELLPLAADGPLEITIAATFPLSEVAAAHELLATGHAGGKIIILP